MEGAPVVLPTVGDLAAGSSGEDGEHAHRRLTVGGELDLLRSGALLEPLGRQLDEARPELLGLREGGADRGADQRNALLSLLKKPGSEL